jgi:hypothetical protein
MIYKFYKFTVCGLWLITAVIILVTGIFIFSDDGGSIKFSGVDAKPWLLLFYTLFSISNMFIGIGVYFQRKITLIFIIPYLILSLKLFIDYVTADYVWVKYAYPMGFMVLLCILSLQSIYFRRKHVTRNA